MTALSPIRDIIEEIRAGRMVVLVDEEDRENEGDLVMAGEFVTPEAINFMAKHGRGLICLTLTEQRCEQLARPAIGNGNRTATADPGAHPADCSMPRCERAAVRSRPRMPPTASAPSTASPT